MFKAEENSGSSADQIPGPTVDLPLTAPTRRGLLLSTYNPTTPVTLWNRHYFF